MRKTIIAILILMTIFTIYSFATKNAFEMPEKVLVTKVIDGDTIEVQYPNKTKKKVRFIGVDTPETKHPTKDVEFYGKEAYSFTKSVLENKTIVMKKEKGLQDRYGRELRHIYLPETYIFLNEYLVEQGYGKASFYHPNTKYKEHFTKLEKEAREAKKGMWKNNSYISKKPEVLSGIVGSSKSNKYHKASCRWAKKINQENLIKFDSVEDAIKEGYEPCGVCKP